MKHYTLTDLERAVIENECVRVNKLNPGTIQWFVGITADADGTGHALVRVSSGGELTRKWGTADELLEILRNNL